MKNKGRKHLTTSGNCKSYTTSMTRPIKMMSKGKYQFMSSLWNKRRKKWWRKRVRGYFKTQHFKNIEF